MLRLYSVQYSARRGLLSAWFTRDAHASAQYESRLAQFEQVAFMDLCEDVDKAENVSDAQYTFPFGGPQVPERASERRRRT